MKQETIDYLKAEITSMEEDLCEMDTEDEDTRENREWIAQTIEAVRIAIACATIPQWAKGGNNSTETLQMLCDNLENEMIEQCNEIADMKMGELIDDRGRTAELAFHLREAMWAIETAIKKRGEQL